MTGLSSNKITEKIMTCINSERLEQLGFTSGFHQRRNRAKITAYSFLMLCLYACQHSVMYSLENLLYFLSGQHNIQVSKQGLSHRFSKASVCMLKSVFEHLYSQLYCEPLSSLSHFSSIRLLDSTTFMLPDCFEEKYKGYGGSSSKSALSIQQEIDLLGNTCYVPILHGGNQNDALHKSHYPIKANEIIIRDLGYWNMEYFTKVDQSDAYFLTRFKYGTKAVFIKDIHSKFQRIDLNTYIKKVIKVGQNKPMEWQVYLGKDKLAVRMIIQQLPAAKVEERLRKKSEKHRKPMNQHYRLFNQVNIFLCNAPKEKITSQKVWDLYRVRWQIELLFKTWKSYAKIHEYKPMSIHRLEALLYSKLIWMLFAYRTYMELQNSLWEKQKRQVKANIVENQVSLLKFTKLFYLQQVNKLLVAFQKEDFKEIQKSIEELLTQALNYVKLEPKNKQVTALNISLNL